MLHINIADIKGLKDELQQEAKELGLSLNAYCRMLFITRHDKK